MQTQRHCANKSYATRSCRSCKNVLSESVRESACENFPEHTAKTSDKTSERLLATKKKTSAPLGDSRQFAWYLHGKSNILKHSNEARFIRRTLHEPNLIIWFGACKDRCMNQLGSTDLYLGRPAVLFDCASRIERQKFDFDSDIELLHVPNQMHTLRINYINYIYPRGLRVPSTWHAQRTSF